MVEVHGDVLNLAVFGVLATQYMSAGSRRRFRVVDAAVDRIYWEKIRRCLGRMGWS
jgi:hypothetical protein